MRHINDDDDDDVFVCGCDVLNDSLNCNVFVSSKYNRIIVVIIVGHFLFPSYRYILHIRLATIFASTRFVALKQRLFVFGRMDIGHAFNTGI